jgi:hypothetical protein
LKTNSLASSNLAGSGGAGQTPGMVRPNTFGRGGTPMSLLWVRLGRSSNVRCTSASPHSADERRAILNVRVGPEADISRQTKTDMHNVRFLLLPQWQPAPLKDCEHCSILRKHIGL